MTNSPTSPFTEMLSILRQHQESQLAMNRNLIEALPPEVRAQIPEDYMTLLEYGFAFVYADAIAYCRNLVEAEKERQDFRTGASQFVPYVTRVDGDPHNSALSNLRFGWTMLRKE